ncbi:MAG: carboxypeptidase regulatory-like domain-containing protein [Planctomycetes bacterium]|nr:carboxypeptidase regulatory-like domain-containing protein [Planctomycetota bacterium]MCP4770955.1 carboxypeptidase regulatory-like domain-containing protein [Planctomycetota bacterium]MCP4861675.1 carboxypeptidase regulatory-like domain-containing protein [Planctomycetota bacterium]
MRFSRLTWSCLLLLALLGACSDASKPSQDPSKQGVEGNGGNARDSSANADQEPDDLPPIDPQAIAFLEVTFTIKGTDQVASGVPFEIRWEEDGKPSSSDVRTTPDGTRRVQFEHGSRLVGLVINPSARTAPAAHKESALLMGGRTHKIHVELERGGIVSGVVLDVEGNPVAGATVGAFFTDTISLDNMFSSRVDIFTRSDENGEFRLGGFPSGHFVLEANWENMMSVWRPGGVMSEARDFGGLEIHLEPGHVVYGQAIDGNEEPIADVMVVAGKPNRKAKRRPTQYEEVFMYGPRACLAKSDEAGLFTLPAVPESQAWNITARHPLFLTSRRVFDAGQQDVWVEMSKGAALAGHVQDSNGAEAVGVQIWMLSADGEPSVFTDKNGTYLFGVGKPRKNVCLLFYKAGFGMKFLGPMNVDVGMEPLDVVLESGAGIAGRVVDASGNGLSGVPVRINGTLPMEGYLAVHMPERFLDRDAVLTSPDGTFQFNELYDSSYTLTVRAPGKAKVTMEGVKLGASDLVLTVE